LTSDRVSDPGYREILVRLKSKGRWYKAIGCGKQVPGRWHKSGWALPHAGLLSRGQVLTPSDKILNPKTWTGAQRPGDGKIHKSRRFSSRIFPWRFLVDERQSSALFRTMPAATARLSAFEVRIALLDVEPEIWRVLRVPHDIRMDRMHGVLQAAFGWTNSHLHQFHLFNAKGVVQAYVGRPDPDGLDDISSRSPPMQDETKRALKDLLAKRGDRIGYEYDFGDGWFHEIALVSVLPQTARLARALCLDGACAAPPEDCGGPPGYDRLREIMRDPEHREHAEMKDWLGDCDLEGFDLAVINRALTRVKT
jgi:Plasmid pRiA4b ORF-3-like protein